MLPAFIIFATEMKATTYTQLWRQLTPLYDEGEAKAIVQMVMEERFGMSLPDLLCGAM